MRCLRGDDDNDNFDRGIDCCHGGEAGYRPVSFCFARYLCTLNLDVLTRDGVVGGPACICRSYD
jgi:hypothetical protein